MLSTSLNKHPCVCRRKLSWRMKGINSISWHAEQHIGDGGLLNHTCEGTADTLIVKTANTDGAKLANTVLVGGGMESSCPALLSCRQAFQRSILSTEAQCKLYQVQGLGWIENQGWTWQQCLSSDHVYPCHPGCDTTQCYNDFGYPQHWKWYQTMQSSKTLHRYSVMTPTLLIQ